MKYGFGGARHLDERGERFVSDWISTLGDGTMFVSGAAHGVDTFAAMEAFRQYPSAQHRIVVPAAAHNEEVVHFFGNLMLGGWGNVEIVAMLPGPEPYRARNKKVIQMLEPDGTFVAFPRFAERWPKSERYTRSGTWMTVRIARRSGLRVIGEVLAERGLAVT